jgi:ketosteroid isomerase-like protein
MAKVKATGKIYNQKYIALVASKNGKITHMKEYWNPLQVQKSFDNLPGL